MYRGLAISEWADVNAGVPQGTKVGLIILFLVMVNDLQTLEICGGRNIYHASYTPLLDTDQVFTDWIRYTKA